MKKTILTALIISAMVSVIPASSYASNNNGKQFVKEEGIEFLKPMITEVSGAIEEITDSGMTVKTKEGKKYWTPINQFLEMEEFKSLKLKVGTAVSMKMMDPSETFFSEGSVGIASVAAVRANNVMKNAVTVEKISELESGLNDGMVFFMAKEITANGKTVKLKGTIMQTIGVHMSELKELSGTVEKITESQMVVKAKDGKGYLVPIERFSKIDGFKELELKIGTAVSLKMMNLSNSVAAVASTNSGIDETRKNEKTVEYEVSTPVAEAILVDKISGHDVEELDSTTISLIEDKLLFIAEEITANGKTVKLQVTKMQTIGMPMSELKELSGTVEKITENDMTVKAKDGKIYLVPIDQFSKIDGFKALELKIGTAVSLKMIDLSKSVAAVASTNSIIDETRKDEKTVENKASISVVQGISAEKISGLNVEELNSHGLKNDNTTISITEGMFFFIAQEITANGKTIKLSE